MYRPACRMSQTGVRSAAVSKCESINPCHTPDCGSINCYLQDTQGQAAAPSPLATLSSSGFCAAVARTGMARIRRLRADPTAEPAASWQ